MIERSMNREFIHGRLPSEEETAVAAAGLDGVLVDTLTRLVGETNELRPALLGGSLGGKRSRPSSK
jgi:hypothetical protein